MKLSVPRDSLSGALQLAGRAVSTRGTLPSLGGILLDAADGTLTLRATDMELGADQHARRRERRAARAPSCCPGRLLADVVRSLPPGEVTLELRARAARRRDRRRRRALPPAHAAGRGLPAPARGRGRDRASCPAAPLAETIDLRRPRRLARRGAPDPHRRPGPGRGRDADDGRHRLLPAQRQAHRARERALAQPLEANVPARALRELARIIAAEGAEEVEIALPRNQVVFRAAGVVALLAPDRGPVPELAPADPGVVRARGPPAARGVPRDRPPDQPARAAQRAAAPGVRRGRADGRRRDARHRRRERGACPRRTRGEPLEIAFNPQFLVEGVESVGAERSRCSSPRRCAPACCARSAARTSPTS